MNRIREVRDAKGLSQKQVAIEVGVKSPSVSHWESGKTKPKQENYIALARLFNVSVDYLMGADSLINDEDPQHEAAQLSDNATEPRAICQDEKRGDIAADDLEGEIAHIAPSAMDVLSQFIRLMNSLPEDKQAQVAEYALMCAKIHEMEAEKTGGTRNEN